MFRFAMTFVLFAATVAAIGCGGGGNGSSSGNGTSGGNGTSSGQTQSFQCCLNGTYYDCSSEAASNACFQASDPSGCSETMVDPSGNCN
jgi:hypothetical protein